MNYPEIIQKIKSHEFSHVYLLDGEDGYLKHTIVDELKRAVLKDPNDNFNIDIFFADQLNWESLDQAVMQIPWGEDYRLVVVKNTQKILSSHKDQLADLLLRLPPTTCLVFIADKFDKKFKFVKDIGRFGIHYTTSELSKKELKDFIKDQLHIYKKSIQPDALDLICEVADPSPQFLVGEVQKLCLYIGNRQKIEIGDVELAFEISHNDDVFNLVELIAQKKSIHSLVLLDVILRDRGQTLSIVGLLRWHIRVLLRVKYYENQRLSPNEFKGKLGVIPFKAQSFIDQARKYTLQQLTYFLLLFSRLSNKLKGADLFEQRYLEAAVLAMSTAIPDLYECFN